MSRKLFKAKPRSGADIEKAAQKIVNFFQPKALKEPTAFDIERFFDCELETLTGVKIDYRSLPSGIHGYTDSECMESVISMELIEDPRNLFFVRSTISHEVGHAVIHVPEVRLRKAILTSIHNKNHSNLTMYRESDIPLYCNPEWQAWRFAGALLMPENTIRMALREKATRSELSNIFKVNLPFIDTRLRALKISLA